MHFSSPTNASEEKGCTAMKNHIGPMERPRLALSYVVIQSRHEKEENNKLETSSIMNKTENYSVSMPEPSLRVLFDK